MMGELAAAAILADDQYPDIGGRKLTFELEDWEVQPLNEFRSTVQGVEGLTCPLNSAFLLRFLRAQKYNIKSSVKVLTTYFKLRRENEYMADMTYDIVGEFYKSQVAIVLKNRNQNGTHILWYRISKWFPKEIKVDPMVIATFHLLIEMTLIAETQKNGIIMILDATDVSLSHAKDVVTECSLKHLLKIFSIFQGSFPARFKGIYVINCPVAFKAVYEVLKYFLKTKLRSRILITSDGPEAIHDYIHPDILPKDLGGNLTLEEAEDTSFSETVLKHEAYHRAIQKMGYAA